ncbi:MAG TPA: hypothetical protein VF885_21560 [Arthrobacter sp.]
MALYPYETQLALNSNGSSLLATDAVVTIYDASDTGMVTPLSLVDISGAPLANPVQISRQGFLPAFQATTPQVLWSGGGFFGYLSSYRGLLNEAAAAGTAAANSALNALNAKVAAEAAAASAAAPTDASVDAGIARANAVAAWKPATAYALDRYAVNPSGVLVKALQAHTSTSTFDATKWTTGTGGGTGGSGTNVVVQNVTTGVIPPRPTTDPAVVVFWVCWTQPAVVTSGTAGAYANDIWMQRAAP